MMIDHGLREFELSKVASPKTLTMDSKSTIDLAPSTLESSIIGFDTKWETVLPDCIMCQRQR